jgi:hypothetical protein
MKEDIESSLSEIISLDHLDKAKTEKGRHREEQSRAAGSRTCKNLSACS